MMRQCALEQCFWQFVTYHESIFHIEQLKKGSLLGTNRS
jgi:hypothetical protein